jgi:drug/metabolite transporter (DMT)-like permease
MRLFLLIALTMTAFAANSVLNRMAVEGGLIEPLQFALIRVAAGAAMLLALVRWQGRPLTLWGVRRSIGAVSLAAYMIGFSLAYRVLDAGLGALILFGVTQVAMFAVTAAGGTRVTAPQGLGAAVAFAGLAWVLWPGEAGLADPLGALSMAIAGLGWAAYSMAGRGEADALAASAANFCLCLPLTTLAFLLVAETGAVTVSGALLAILSGAVTSGLGYALWYTVLPRIPAVVAANALVSVPLIAIAGGALVLGEAITWQLVVASVVVLGGILLSVQKPRSG